MSGYTSAAIRPADTNRAGLLRTTLRLDAIESVTLGAATGLLWAIGGFLVLFAGTLWSVGSRAPANRAAVRAVIGFNALWVVVSVLLVVAGPLELTGVGVAFVLGQAVAVGVLTELQYVGLRRTDRVAAE